MDHKMLHNVFDVTPIETRALVFEKYYKDVQKSVRVGGQGKWILVPPSMRKHIAKLANSFGFNGPELFIDEPIMLVIKMRQEHKGWHPTNWKASKISFEYVNVG
jgi:hypothetical protein